MLLVDQDTLCFPRNCLASGAVGWRQEWGAVEMDTERSLDADFEYTVTELELQ